MKKIKTLIVYLFLIGLSFNYFGCADLSTDPVNDGISEGFIPVLPNSAGSSGVFASVMFDQLVQGDLQVNYIMGYANLSGSDAGTVLLANQEIKKNGSLGNYIYSSFNPDKPTTLFNVVFDGVSQHNWAISGAGSIPSASFSQESPSDFSLNRSLAGQTIDKTKGFTLSWSSPEGPEKYFAYISTTKAGGNEVLVKGSVITGISQFTFSPEALATLNGEIRVQVAKYKESEVKIGNKTYAVFSQVVRGFNCKIN